MIKLAANAALMTRISFINEIANVSRATGATSSAWPRAPGSTAGSSSLRAGIGYGGSCFPKDSLALKQLAANSGYHFQLLNAVIEVNELQKRRVIGKLQQHLGTLRQDRRAARARLQAEHRRRPRSAEPRARGRLVAEGAWRCAWDPVAEGDCAASATICADPLEAHSTARTPPCS